MTLAVLMGLVALGFLKLLKKGEVGNPNGLSVSILQLFLRKTQAWLVRHPTVSRILFAYPNIKDDTSLQTKQVKIEGLVWSRLLAVSVLAVAMEGLIRLSIPGNFPARCATVFYLLLLQATLFLALLRPLFGAKTRLGLPDLQEAYALAPHIPAPRRSLLMALANFAEIAVSWGIIYRCIIPETLKTMDHATYYSVVTLTTLGYGDVHAGDNFLMHIAVTANMFAFTLFTVCHVTTILGALSGACQTKGGNQ